jgi:hypothetical protein
LEFSKLQEYNGRFFTSSSFILKKQITSTCIGTFFTQNLTALEEKFPIRIDKRRETLTPISGDSYILQTTKPQTITVACKTRTEHLPKSKEEKLTLKQGCKIAAEEHVMFAGKHINEKEKVHE